MFFIKFLPFILFLTVSCTSKKAENPPPKPEVVPNSSLSNSEKNALLSENEKQLEQGIDPNRAKKQKLEDRLARMELNRTPDDSSPGNPSPIKKPPLFKKESNGVQTTTASKGERDTLKFTCGSCASKSVTISVIISPGGNAKLEEGQVLDTKLVECLVNKLSRVSFFKGSPRRARFTIP